ncbi:DNA polymerase III subunit gamma/tau [Lottiidibacillus patelloidae]|uniref:DNA-directed DNA polymerase n=1 Tax=Lottiidibacillus patelloidae TaxID=2670334 RepID=A0A263BPL9_9BACI|nr:DNA polymerase III subunit gamma/tau [Lottiidibacillus patelloidae]OZM55725.1 DNA polymerase III subunit gamma/tau [Lottiidibacillus patelloidae]
MSYQALYRVWRPQSFEDVVGQEHITKTLQNALLKNKVSHAYLFSGPRGTGKTSAAKIIAKAVNCKQAPTAEPCNECEACIGITNGSISDVIEIDAASNNGVDEIRDIRDNVKFAPSVVTYKVYIVDEVHMLSTSAFNALLKTLEEPPAHVIFILATTEPHKIPLTIISRCQRFDFKRITSDAIVGRMKKITNAQQINVEDSALKIIARKADGGMRDALSLLDQAVSYSEDVISDEAALAVTGAVSQTILENITKSLLENNAAEALTNVDEMLSEGKDPVRFIEDLIYYFRDILLYKTAPSFQDGLERANVDEAFISLSEQIDAPWLYHAIDELNKHQQQMRFTNHTKIYLELAVVTISSGGKADLNNSGAGIKEVQELISKVGALESELAKLKESRIIQEEPKQKPQPKERRVSSGGKKLQVSRTKINEVLRNATKQDLQRIQSQWGEILERINSEQVSSHAWVKEGKPVLCSNNTFIIAFPHTIHAEMSAKENVKSLTEKASAAVLGQHLEMISILEEDWNKVKEEFIRSQGTDGVKKEEESDPLIEEATKLVGKELIEITE